VKIYSLLKVVKLYTTRVIQLLEVYGKSFENPDQLPTQNILSDTHHVINGDQKNDDGAINNIGNIQKLLYQLDIYSKKTTLTKNMRTYKT
jgi:hypothetical protein